MFLLQLTALTRNPQQAMQILDGYEQACLAETCTTRIASSSSSGDPGATDASRELQARLIAEEKRLALAAKISWARYARSELKALAVARASGQANGQSGEQANGEAGGQASEPGSQR